MFKKLKSQVQEAVNEKLTQLATASQNLANTEVKKITLAVL
jgi:hypothetical protein